MKKLLLQSKPSSYLFIKTIVFTIIFLASFPTKANFVLDDYSVSENPSKNYLNQQIIIKGVVKDENGVPLPGANIIIKGTSIGVITSMDGTFQIEVPSAETVLEFSFLGYTKQSITVGKQTNIIVNLQLDSQSLSEMVVVGYATEQKALLTSSVGIVKVDNLKNIPVATIDGIMQGQTSGVQVSQNSGTPGGEMSVRIRGVSSITGSSQPLYIIDGIPVITGDYAQVGYEGQGINSLSDLNPSDIESITILKDAAAASIYGARATNGVVVITTKRGNSQKTKIDFNTYFGVQQVWRTLDMLDSRQWMDYWNDLSDNPVYSEEDMKNITIDTDWQKEIFRTAPMSNYELSATGGDSKTKYFMSGSYFTQEGVLIGTGYSRFNGRLNIDHTLTDKLSIGASIGLTYSITDRVEGDQSLHGPLPNGISTPAIYPVYNEDGTYNQEGPYSNPVSIANEAINKNYSFRSIANAYLNYQIIPSLSFSTKWGIDFLSFREHAFEFNTVQGQKYNGLGFETYTNVMNLVSNNILKYQTNLDKNDFEVLLGYSFESNQERSSYIRAQDYTDASMEYINTASTYAEVSSDALDEGLRSFFGRANYNYDNKYIASFSMRSDASSNFGENNRTGYFPAMSLAWRLGQEEFFNLPTNITELKIRTSYGLTGNDDIAPHQHKELYKVTKYNDISGIYPSNIPNPDLKWETTAQFNLGIDFAMYDNRLFLTADFYNKQTKDLLFERPLPSSSGFYAITENIGSVENKGFELGITTDNLKGDFKWTTQLNLSTNKNKVLELYKNQSIIDQGRGGNAVIVGEPIGVFYIKQWLGVDPSTGDVVYADVNHDGSITDDDRDIVGNPHPDFIGGLTNNFNYKGIDLSIFLQWSYGNDVFHGSRLYLESLTGEDAQLEAVTRRWQQPGDITDIPRATSDDKAAELNRQVSSRFIEDGSYLRIKNISLGYTFDKKMISKLKIENLRVYISSQNLYTFTNYSGLDPEVNYTGDDNTVMGTDFFTYPQTRSYTFGINLKF